MRLGRCTALLAAALVTVSLPGVASSAGTVSGTVTRLSDGSPLQGARVTAAAPGQPPVVAVTAADGTFSVNIGGNGPYGVSVEATGFASQSFADVQAGTPLAVALDSARFTPLPVNGAAVTETTADATSGIFYGVARQAPEVYRTLDYGGTWQAVPMRYDDPDTGLDRNFFGPDVIAASGVGGEVAVATWGGETTGAVVRYSRDFGVTWTTVGGALPATPPQESRFLFWGHASPGAPSVLLIAQREADHSWSAWRADMSASSPSLTREPADPFGTGSVVAGAHAGDGAFVGRVTAAGELSFARLNATDPIAFGSPDVTGLPNPPDLLRLGGAREASAPPDGALVVGGSPFAAQLLTKATGSATFAGGSFSAPSTVPAICRYRNSIFDVGHGSVAPTSSDTSGSGSVAQCWVTKADTSLTYWDTCCEAADVAYDAGWGAGNFVLLRGGFSGPMKAARLDGNGVPEFLPESDALPGPGPDTGGMSVVGIVSAVVDDTAYGPTAPQVAVAVGAGKLTLASRDGGQSFSPVLNRGWGSSAAQWWQGASGQWLVFGHGGPNQNLLTAALNWDGTSLGQPNVQGTHQEDLGGVAGSTGYAVQTLQAVPGADTIFIALGFPFDPNTVGDSHLYRARIVPGSPPSLADVFSFDSALSGITFYNPQALAYCPSSAADARMRDVLFVATGDEGGLVPDSETKGSLLRITGATTASPAVTEIASVPHGTQHTVRYDVRADCAQGVVYTGGGVGPEPLATLYKSTDAGLTFTGITMRGSGGTYIGAAPIFAIGLNPADPNDVKVASDGGLVQHSSDGGGTWTVVNDPLVGRPMLVRDIEYPPGGGSRALSTAPLPVLGTGSGAFRGDVSVGAGIIGLSPSVVGQGLAREQLTTLASDGEPAAVANGNGTSATVFRRSNGLYYASTAPQAGWSRPVLIPGTAGAVSPAAALDSTGRLVVAFSRTGQAPGIYVVEGSAAGVWSTPVRASNRAGDVLPAIAIGRRNSVEVVFLRTRGGRGVYAVSGQVGRWSRARRVRGTGRADAKRSLGGPTIAARSGTLHVAFGRSGRRRGIIYLRRRGSRWSAPARLTRSADSQPTLAVSRSGKRQIVFHRRGLLALRATRSWSLVRIRRTIRADTQPTLSASGTGFTLVFARPGSANPGIYVVRTPNGRWTGRPIRLTTSPGDRNPSVRSNAQARETIVFERG